MKKKIIIFVFIFCLILVSLIIPNEFYSNLFNNKEQEPVYVDSCLVYLLDSNDKLVGVNIPLEKEIEDEFVTTWNLLTVDVPKDFTSPIYFSTQVITKEINNGIMKLNITEDFNVEVSRSTLECLVYNFCKEDVEKIELSVEGNIVNEVNGVHFEYLSRDLGVNLVYESLDILNSIDLTVIYEYEEYQLPVTYYVDDNTDIVTFFVDKSLNLIDEVGNIDYTNDISFELTDKKLEINVANFESFNKEVLNTLKSSLTSYFDLEEISINGLAI